MTRNRVDDLSDRQVRCLELVADLQTTKQIATTLGIAPSTVDTHIQRAIEILGLRNRAEAARVVLARGRAGPDDFSSGSARLADPVAIEPSNPPSSAANGELRNRLSTSQRLAAGLAALVLLSLAVAGLGAAIGKLSDWRYAVAKARQEHGPLRAETEVSGEFANVSRSGGSNPHGVSASGADGQRGGGEKRQAAGYHP